MFSFLSFVLKMLFISVKSKKQFIVRIALLEKELEIYKRKDNKKKFTINQIDRIILALLNKCMNIKDTITIVKPETLLKWQRQLIKSFWTLSFLLFTIKPEKLFNML